MSEGTFSIVPNWLIRDTDLTGRELLVYIALLNRADRFGRSWPSMRTLCKESRSDERVVKQTLKKLEARGMVTVTRRPRKNAPHLTNLYEVAVFDRSSPEMRSIGAQKCTTVGDRNAESRGTELHPEVDTREVDTDEVDMRSALASGPTNSSFSFSRASEKQVAYLRDLYLHYESKVPSPEVIERFELMSPQEATQAINTYLRVMPRYDEYEGPEYGSPEYDALSPTGQAFADQGMVPDSLDGT